jgi:pyridoxine 5-phosphate synthase
LVEIVGALMIPRLGINIDHVAALRQLSGEEYPSVVDAAQAALLSGADQISIHLREDRRHIQDTDVETVRLVTKRFGKPLNLQIGIDPEILEIAIASTPDWISFVPERKELRVPDAGLDILDDNTFIRLEDAIKKIRGSLKDVKISLCLEAKIENLVKASQLGVDAVEIYTGEYAKVFFNGDEVENFIIQFRNASNYLHDHQILSHAGQGLTEENIKPLLAQKIFDEYNIGHWVICQGLFTGLANTIKNLKTLFNGER